MAADAESEWCGDVYQRVYRANAAALRSESVGRQIVTPSVAEAAHPPRRRAISHDLPAVFADRSYERKVCALPVAFFHAMRPQAPARTVVETTAETWERAPS